MAEIGASIREHFATLEDPRAEHLVDHPLLEILVIAICAVICGADGWTDIALFGQERLVWLRQFLALKSGPPSHDTFGRVFARLNAEQFEACFLHWVRAVFDVSEGQVVAIDGKSVRRSHERGCGQEALHLVHAWATANHLLLGQLKTEAHSNEITAIPQLLQLLDVSGCIVTIDAIGCQREIAQAILAADGDYLLAVKENQGHLLEDIELFFELAQQNNFHRVNHSYQRSVNKGHGRLEIRHCWTISGEESLQFLREWQGWPALKSLVKVTAERQTETGSSQQTRYYISSLDGDARQILAAVRSHWGIENGLHWVLDVAFDEDRSRVRKEHGPENLALLRRIALNLLKQEKTLRRGIQGKRLKAALNPDYLLKVLSV